MTIAKQTSPKCENSPKFECSEMYNCCDCGGNACGCSYCWSCNACDTCKEEADA